MPVEMYIRDYKKTDIHIIRTLNRIAMEHIGVYKPGCDGDLDDVRGNYQRNRGAFLVGTVNGIIVSMGAFRRIDRTVAEVKRMRTFPEYQGRGYGERILTELIRRARKLGYRELVLETSATQLFARKLYAKLGFSPYKEEVIDGFDCTWFRMAIG